MADSRDVLKWTSLTAMVNELKVPNRFIKGLLFSDEQPKPTEVVEIGVLVGDRMVAPFVRRGAEAIEITPFQEKFYNVSMPNIRIKRRLEASELLFDRHVGHVIFAQESDVMSGANEHIARNSLRLVQTMDEAEEYLCAQALRGSITYTVNGEEAFSVTYPRSASHAVTLSNFWDGMSADVELDFRTALQLVADDAGLSVTHAIMGAEATNSFLKDSRVLAQLDNRRVTAGGLDLNRGVEQSGAIYLGVYRGVSCWSYTRKTQVPSAAGLKTLTSFDLIRPKYVEFVTADPAAENVMYYGAISDIDALEGRAIQAKRFSKSWKQPDPSVMWQLAHTRPLPVLRRPDSTVSMKVISG